MNTPKTVITIDDIINTMKAKHAVFYKNSIKKAAKYAEEMHKGVPRLSGEPYINHPIRVAYSVASWGLESEAVVAALLHDVVEDCEGVSTETISKMFSVRIANLVDSVTSVDSIISNAEKKKLTKSDIDRMSDTKLIKNMNRTALLIKIADRLDNLTTIGCFSIEKQVKKARDTREILIPLAEIAGAYQLIDELENLCVKIEHHDRFVAISEAYNKMLIHNSASTTIFLNSLSSLVDSLTGLSNDTLSNTIFNDNKGTVLGKAIKKVEYKKRSISSLYRQIIRKSDKIKMFNALNIKEQEFTNKIIPDQFEQILLDDINIENTAIYDITLIINDEFVDAREAFDVNDIFFQFYDKYLINNGVRICSVCYTPHGKATYVLIMDKMDNLYRVFTRSESDYVRFKLGDIVDGMDEFNFKVIDEDDPRNTFNNKIKVFRRDGSAMYIDEGATVLDFAFAIHTEIGLHFNYAIIDGDPSQQPPYRRLSEGDLVIVYDSEEITPSLKWFKYVRTSKAIERLVKAISDIYGIST